MLFFLHPLFLTALVCIGVPVLLHFMMKQKPQKFPFPALRFLQVREKNRKNSLKIKHLLLLAVRILLVALLALLFARPSFLFTLEKGKSTNPSNSDAIFYSSDPSAALLIFDTSVRMDYKFKNQTRLEAAQAQAEKIVLGLPSRSVAAVVSSHLAPLAFSPDRAEILRQIEQLELSPNARPLPEVVTEALALFQNSDLPQKEVFLFTDESAASWEAEGAGGRKRLTDALKKVPNIQLTIIPVSVPNPSNNRLDLPDDPQFQTVSGGVVQIQTRLFTDDALPHRIGLFLADENGIPKMRGEITTPAGTPKTSQIPQNTQSSESVQISENAQTSKGPQTSGNSQKEEQGIPLEFQLGALREGPNQGFLKILDGDALTVDDTRYFTIQKDPPTPILLVAEDPAERNAFFIRQALAPTQFTFENRSKFTCQILSFAQFSQWVLGSRSAQTGTLNQFEGIFFLDPPELSPAVWNRLAQYVNSGGGTAFFFGPTLRNPAQIQIPEARQFLAAIPGFQARFPNGTFFSPHRGAAHPILNAFQKLDTSVPWDEYPVFRAWTLCEIPRDAQTLFTWTNGTPALVTRNYGSGRVLVCGTPLQPTQSGSKTVWNLLPQADSWVFLVLVNASAEFLSTFEASAAHITPADALRIPLRGALDEKFKMYKIQNSEKPTAKEPEIPLFPDTERRQLDVPQLETVGNYQISGSESDFRRGFSVNLPFAKTDLRKTTREEIQNLFLPYSVTFLPRADILKRTLSGSSTGGELFPILGALILVLIFVELMLSNRFYERHF